MGRTSWRSQPWDPLNVREPSQSAESGAREEKQLSTCQTQTGAARGHHLQNEMEKAMCPLPACMLSRQGLSAWVRRGAEQLRTMKKNEAGERVQRPMPQPHLLPLPPLPCWVQLGPEMQDLPRAASHHRGRRRQAPRGNHVGDRKDTHQFFVHFCFDVSGESEKCLWNKDVVSIPAMGSRWAPAGSSAPTWSGTVGWAGVSPVQLYLLPLPTKTTTSPEPTTLAGGITFD